MNVPMVANTQLSQQLNRMSLAKDLCRSRHLPQSLQGSPGDVYMVMEVCDAAGLLFPLAVWEVSIIKGRAMFGGKFAAALLHNSGQLATRLSYTFTGKTKEDLACMCSATLKGETEPRTVEARWIDAKTEHNANWQNNPEQQLSYYMARMWGRRHAPEVLLGATFEGEVIDITPVVEQPRITHPTMVQDERTIPDKPVEQPVEQPQNTNTAETKADDEAQPFTLTSATEMDGKSWAAWTSTFLAYIRAASSADVINDWLNWNADTLAALSRYHPVNYKTLTGKVKAEMVKWEERVRE